MVASLSLVAIRTTSLVRSVTIRHRFMLDKVNCHTMEYVSNGTVSNGQVRRMVRHISSFAGLITFGMLKNIGMHGRPPITIANLLKVALKAKLPHTTSSHSTR